MIELDEVAEGVQEHHNHLGTVLNRIIFKIVYEQAQYQLLMDITGTC